MIELRVGLPPSTGYKVFSPLQDKIREDYPSRKQKYAVQGQFTFKAGDQPEMATSGKHRQVGYLFTSESGQKVVQMGVDGFAFNWLKPYADWGAFSTEARRLWELYKAVGKPTRVTRIGLRYINKIETGMSDVELADWLVLGPRIPKTLPQKMAGFFVRIPLLFQEEQAAAIITLTTEEASEKLALIVDIDVIDQRGQAAETDVLWRRLDVFRDIKNRVFFESISEKTQELLR